MARIKFCERCGKAFSPQKSYHFLCQKCKLDDYKISNLMERGHTQHCACRQIFADGECECDVEGKGDGLSPASPRFHERSAVTEG